MWRSFWKGLTLFVAGGIIGLGVGFAIGIFAYPYIFLADLTATEEVAGRGEKTVVARATFIHPDPNDPVHYGKGRATLFQDLVHLESDFEVGPGPRFHVYLSPRADVKRSADFDEARSLDLGQIKAFKGSQNYPIPDGTDLSRYKSIVIWCKAFGVLISPATLDLSDAGR
ncbi:MAG TPA: DM13 domain-containing protein [Alphaproteobacteria bacterium]|jgi:hypothetical protein